jgi:hypothetical protein
VRLRAIDIDIHDAARELIETAVYISDRFDYLIGVGDHARRELMNAEVRRVLAGWLPSNAHGIRRAPSALGDSGSDYDFAGEVVAELWTQSHSLDPFDDALHAELMGCAVLRPVEFIVDGLFYRDHRVEITKPDALRVAEEFGFELRADWGKNYVKAAVPGAWLKPARSPQPCSRCLVKNALVPGGTQPPGVQPRWRSSASRTSAGSV